MNQQLQATNSRMDALSAERQSTNLAAQPLPPSTERGSTSIHAGRGGAKTLKRTRRPSPTLDDPEDVSEDLPNKRKVNIAKLPKKDLTEEENTARAGILVSVLPSTGLEMHINTNERCRN